MRLELKADSVKVNGPKVDGSYAVTFEAGEYQSLNVAKLLAIPKGTVINIRIEVQDKDEGYKEQA